MPSQQTRDVDPMLIQCWANVEDGGPTLNQYWVNVSCLLGLRDTSDIARFSKPVYTDPILRPRKITREKPHFWISYVLSYKGNFEAGSVSRYCLLALQNGADI